MFDKAYYDRMQKLSPVSRRGIVRKDYGYDDFDSEPFNNLDETELELDNFSSETVHDSEGNTIIRNSSEEVPSSEKPIITIKKLNLESEVIPER